LKVYLDTIGCRLNQSEIEMLARQFRAAGHTLVESAKLADLAVVNTCAVTEAAASDSRQKVRQAALAGAGEIVVTGCWATIDPAGAAALPKVKQVTPNVLKDQLVAQVLQTQVQDFDREFIEREAIPGARLRTRAFIKVQDGCNNRCTFCITTIARGAARSRPVKAVLNDVFAALAGGAQEVVLTGVHLGCWGYDLPQPQTLATLIKILLSETDLPRLRLSSLEPWDLAEDFFSLWQDRRLCRHLHLPLQSGSSATLRRMGRKTTPEAFARLAAAARQACPDIAITTDIIAGFPGETQAEFEESLAFTAEMNFAGGHVFPYSSRPGTVAARMPAQVPPAVRKQRSARFLQLFAQASETYQRRFIGAELPILWESACSVGPEGWQMSGLTDNYLRVYALAPQRLWNQISRVQLKALTQRGLWGELVE